VNAAMWFSAKWKETTTSLLLKLNV
jgi:hypothetical protein